jgi:hypothetical protein
VFFFYPLNLFAPASLLVCPVQKICALAAFLTVFPRSNTSFLLLCIGFSGNIWALKRIIEFSLLKAGLMWWSK